MSSPSKLTRKEKIAIQKDSGQKPMKELLKAEVQQRPVRLWLGVLLAIAGFLFFSNTLNHGYVMDDYGLIKENSQTRKGSAAIGEIFKSSYRYGMNTADYVTYRPLSKAMFAVEWGIAPGKAALGHWINVILFALSCFALFHFLSRLFKGNLLIPFITTLLFAVHPIHTEVVANIKSRDEIVAFFLIILSCNSLLTYSQSRKTLALFTGLLLYFISLFAKESTITFLAIFPLMYFVFTDADRSQYVKTLLPAFLLSLLYLGIRKSVLGSHGDIKILMADNSLVGIDGFFNQRLNAIAIIGMYLKLFVLPFPLMSDASYNQIPPLPLSSWKIWVPFVILAGGFVYSLLRLKKKDPVSFGILFFIITFSITSNVFILIGTNYAERLLYLPSLGIFLSLAILLDCLFESESTTVVRSISSFFKSNLKPVSIILFISAVLATQTYARNKDWSSNSTLYRSDAKKANNSAHMLFYLANYLSTDSYQLTLSDSAEIKKANEEAIRILTRAIKIYPSYADAYESRGYIYYKNKQPDLAEQDYLMALKFNPAHPIVLNHLGGLYFDREKYDLAKENFEKSTRFGPTYAQPWNNLASVYGMYGEKEKQLMEEDPTNAEKHAAQAKAYFEQAIGYFKKSIEADAEFAEAYRLMSVTYRNLGDQINGDKYETLARSIKSKVGQAK